MKIRRILCLAAVFCLLWSTAAADGQSYSGSPVSLIMRAVMPYSWTTQEAEEQANVKYLLDGNTGTGFRHVCQDSRAKDKIPEITFYFANATIRGLWIRNGWESARYPYTAYARVSVVRVDVWTGDKSYGPYWFALEDTNDPTVVSPSMIDGYQRLSLPRKFTNVTRVDLYIKSWAYHGDSYTNTACMSDLVFLPDTLQNLYGSKIFDPDYDPYGYVGYGNNPTPARTAAPTRTPVQTPVPRPTEVPRFTGRMVTAKERIASRSGPGTNYTETGSYHQAGARVKALSAAYDDRNGIWWIQVEVSYGGELRRVYTGVKRLEMNAEDVPVEESEGSALLTRSVYAYYGPGYGYSMYKKAIPAGTFGTVWQRESSYALFEYDDGGSLRRVWVPEKALETGVG